MSRKLTSCSFCFNASEKFSVAKSTITTINTFKQSIIMAFPLKYEKVQVGLYWDKNPILAKK